MKVKLIAYTPNPEELCAAAAKTCHSREYPGKMSYNEVNEILEIVQSPGIYEPKEILKALHEKKKKDVEDARKVVEIVRALGHHSVMEHASFTFLIEGISRACSHQIVRHRIASYSQQSQRYVEMKDFPYVIPNTIKNNKDAIEIYNEFMKKCSEAYEKLVDSGIPMEDARYILPNATQTSLIMTMNARSLWNFFSLRCCEHAQWEIKNVANKMLKEVKKVAPTLFRNAGAPCVRGFCPENDKNCPRYRSVEKVISFSYSSSETSFL